MKNTVKIFAMGATLAVLSACGGGGEKDEDQIGFTTLNEDLTDIADLNEDLTDFADLKAWNTGSQFATAITDCVKAEELEDACTFETLPLIGMQTDNPSKSDILDRLVVSHDWMGRRFEALLDDLPPAMLPIFSSVTAIVIDDDIRPAYYTNMTSAIYLDPAYIWLTPSEAATINPQQDFRSGFDNELAFKALSRSIKNNARTPSFGSISNPVSRSINDIRLNFSSLLLHELAHAHDFFPADEYLALNRASKPLLESKHNTPEGISRSLTDTNPLDSQMLLALGRVMYLGDTATQQQKEFTPLNVGDAFEVDKAVTAYAYSTRFEDTATLFEEVMMKYFFDVDQDIAFTTSPTGEAARFCNNYIIRWGVRNRIGDTRVKDRAQFVVNQILPQLPNSDMFFQDLPAPIMLTTNSNWCSTSTQAQGDINNGLKPEVMQPFHQEDLQPNHH